MASSISGPSAVRTRLRECAMKRRERRAGDEDLPIEWHNAGIPSRARAPLANAADRPRLRTARYAVRIA